MHSRSTFYPLPPSVYPKPVIDPCPALESSYGHDFGSHSLHDAEFYRSRTLHPQTRASTAPLSSSSSSSSSGIVTSGPLKSALYPTHGAGTYSLPYYRRDSKGFRQHYHQPPSVDTAYLEGTLPLRRASLVSTGLAWCHPSSRTIYTTRNLNVALDKDGNSSTGIGQTAGGYVLGTSFKNSGLYDAKCNVRGSTVPLDVYEGLRGLNQNPFSSALHHDGSALTERPAIYHEDNVVDETSANTNRGGGGGGSRGDEYGSGDAQMAATRPAPFGDPLLADARDNAYRKARTVYKRAYGLST